MDMTVKGDKDETKVRFNFETNSSSTHSLTILSEEDFNRFEKGEIFIDWNGKV